MTHEDEKSIYAEYKVNFRKKNSFFFFLFSNIKQELEDKSSTYRQSTFEPEYAIYNRYANIAARGPCKLFIF